MALERRLVGLTLSMLLLAGCGKPDGEHVSAARAAGSFEQFQSEAVSVLERRCGAGCHGVAADGYRAQQQAHPQGFYFPIEHAGGRIPREADALRAAYQAATGVDAPRSARIDYGAPARFSALLRAPLAEDYGGLPHRGLDVFFSTEDPDYQALARWVEREIAERPVQPGPLAPPAAFFRDQVLGVLARNGCFLGNCHGPSAFNDLKLQPPLPALDGEGDVADGFSRQMLLANRRALLGEVTRFANLGGDLRLSRLIVKNLPIAAGGVHQRGGNDQFFASFEDRDVQILLDWLALERKALAAQLTAAGEPIAEADIGHLQGIVFIRGPRHAPRRFFDLDPYWPGSDIYLLPEGAAQPINLTAPFHAGREVEIQSLDVRYDARAIVFAMREQAGQGFRLYELRLKADLSGAESVRQISFAPQHQAGGDLIHHIDPVYIPGPDDPEGHALDKVAVAYASNEAGAYGAALPWGLVGEADGGEPGTLIDRQRSERPGSLAGRRIAFVAGPHAGDWRTIAEHRVQPGGGSALVLDRPLAGTPDRRTVYVIEQTEAQTLPAYDIWRLVPLPGDPAQAFRDSARRMTWSDAQERRPTARSSGEVMFTAVRNLGYQGDRPVYNGAIFRVQAGGFDYHVHGGNRSRYPLYADARELPSGLELRLALDPRNLSGGGALLLADHGLGINAEPDNPMDGLAYTPEQGAPPAFASTPRHLPAQVAVFPEAQIAHTGRSPEGAVRDPYPLPDGSALLALAPGPLDHLDPDADPDWDIYRLRFAGSPQSADGTQAGPVHLEHIAGASSAQADYAPRPLTIRLKEHAEPHQKFRADLAEDQLREEFGVRRAAPGTPAVIECFDYPLLQTFLTDFAPAGARDLAAADRQFRYVRIVAQLPMDKVDAEPLGTPGDPFATPVSAGVHGRRMIVAEVPLEADGSFYAEVPPETPLLLQGLDAQRRALHSMNRWFYLHSGERLTFSIPRSLFPMACAGCHGSLTGEPLDALGAPDLVTASSRVMANWDPAARERRKPYAGEPLTIDFARDVQPILDRRCVRCHGTSNPAAGLPLAGTPTRHNSLAYEALLHLRDPASGNFADRRYVNEREALSAESPLIDRLLAGHPEDGPLTEDERLTLIRWIDLGATFRGGRP